jgi:hypothetical protein
MTDGNGIMAKFFPLPRTLLIVGALAFAPALAFAQTATTPAATATPTVKAETDTKAAPALPATKAETPAKSPVKPVAHVHSKRVQPKLQPATTKPVAPALPAAPKS